MKTWIFAATGAALLAGGAAIAQPAPGAPPPPPPGQEEHHPGMGPGMEGGRMEHHGMGGWMHRHRPPMPPKAAFFRFRKGDASVTIKCADDEPMKACVDAGSALLDKLGAMPK